MVQFMDSFKISASHYGQIQQFKLNPFTHQDNPGKFYVPLGSVTLALGSSVTLNINHTLTDEDDHGPFHGALPRLQVYTC